MKALETELPGVRVLEPVVHGDDRGFFYEAWNAETFRDLGLDLTFVQDNHSASARGTLRGLHYQVVVPQGKLVRCTRGAIWDVAVDIRRASPTFREWTALELTEENKLQLWIPPGFAHGFLALTEGAEVQYRCTAPYHPEHDRSLAWDDPELGVEWPLDRVGDLLLSEKDRTAPPLASAEIFS